jgi:hypothetical protein
MSGKKSYDAFANNISHATRFPLKKIIYLRLEWLETSSKAFANTAVQQLHGQKNLYINV